MVAPVLAILTLEADASAEPLEAGVQIRVLLPAQAVAAVDALTLDQVAELVAEALSSPKLRPCLPELNRRWAVRASLAWSRVTGAIEARATSSSASARCAIRRLSATRNSST